ncbi:MAG: zf-HC2 domain-containing protein [Pleurocapsa minor HA4230-MV1]|jgi:anti-sigma factor RsiW|nr:zf-HC2 domain-containing protein [Pleurocapsa minor HA4230-MV1]
MTSKFEDLKQDKSMASLNKMELPSDSFELLSAYLDGELSPTERHQVQTWIDRDPQTKALYFKLLALQSQMQGLEAPPSQITVGEMTEQVFQALDRQHHQRRLVLSGSAIAVSCLATITGLIFGITSPGLKVAQSPNSGENLSDNVMLAVALNKPTINIPKSVDGYSTQ